MTYSNLKHTGFVYSSISAALAALDDHKTSCEKTGDSYGDNQSYNRRMSDFTAFTSYQDALNLLGNGWVEGATKIAAAAHIDGINAMSDTEYLPTFFPDVAGAYGFAAAALAGDPECFYRYDIQPQEKPVLRLAVNSGLRGDVDAGDVINRAAAYLYLINTIEQSGTRVELWLIAGNRSVDAPTKNEPFEAVFNAVRVKESDQPTDLNRLAFLIGHAAMHRRLVFGLIEKAVIDWEKTKGISFTDGYGIPLDIARHDLGCQLIKEYLGNDVYMLPAFSDNNALSNTPVVTLTLQCINALERDGIITWAAAQDLINNIQQRDKAA